MDCTNITRFKDPQGRYYCQDCYQKIQQAEAARVPAATPPPRPGQVCPDCQALLPAGSVSCPACGFNLATGRRPAPPAPTTSPRARSAFPLRAIVGIGLVVIIGVTLTIVIKRLGGSSDEINARLAAIRTEGYPVSVAELDQWYKTPESPNAATRYLEALSLLAPDNMKTMAALRQGQVRFPPRSGALSAQTKRTLENLLAENKRALELLHNESALREARYPVDLKQGMNALLPYLSQLKQAAQLLQLEAVAAAESGRPELAAKSIAANIHLANSLAAEPLVLSQLVRIADLAIVLQGLERVLTRTQLAEGPLKELQSGLAEAEKLSGMTRALAGERCLQIHFYSMPAKERAKVISNLGDGASQPEGVPEVFSERLLRQDFLFFLDIMQSYIQATQAPFPERMATAEQIDRRVQQKRKSLAVPYATSILVALQKTISKDTRNVAYLRDAQLALALERFRLAQGHAFPESLERLVPEYIAAIPADPFSGQPLRWEKLPGRGYVVYSVGDDRADDHGASTSPSQGGRTSAQATAADDVAFSVER